MNMILLAGGLLLIALGLGHGAWWRMRFHDSTASTGLVVDLQRDINDDSPYCYPVVRYIHDGLEHEFRSNYSGPPTPFVGATVPLIISRDGSHAEIDSLSNHRVFTWVPLLAGMGTVVLATIA